LVAEEQLTGSKRVCLLADGSKVEAPIARVSIDTSYYIGEVEAWCLSNPLFELIVGSIPNVRDPADPGDDWELDVVEALTTRQQAQREGRRDKHLRVPDVIGPTLDLSPSDLVKAQEDDKILRKIRTLAHVNLSTRVLL
jgi:hypothetical protein